MRRSVGVGLVLFGVFVVVNMAADVQRGRFPAMLPGFVVLVALPFIPVLNGLAAARQWEKLNPSGHRTITIELDEDGFRSATYVGALEIRWAAVKQVVETSEFLLVYVTERFGYYLPIRALSALDLSRVRQLVRSRVDQRRVHLVKDAAA